MTADFDPAVAGIHEQFSGEHEAHTASAARDRFELLEPELAVERLGGGSALAVWPLASLLAVDIAALAAASLIVTALGLAGAEGGSSLAWAFGFGATVMATLAVRGGYTRRLRVQVIEDVGRASSNVLLAAMAVITVRTLVTGDASGAGETAALAALSAGLLLVGRLSLGLVLVRALRAGQIRRPTLILGAGKVGNLTAARLLASPEWGLEPVGFLDNDPLEAPGERPVLPVLGGPPDLDRMVEEHGIEHLIVGFSMASHQLMLALIRRCWELGVSVSLVPRLFEVEQDRSSMNRLGGLPLVSLSAPQSKGVALTLKYAIDRTVAAIAIVLLAPVLLVVSLAVWIFDGRPIFYRQHRVGRDGRHFVMLKFRTMRGVPEHDGEADLAWAEDQLRGREGSVHDAQLAPRDRRTRLGRFLRRLSLDELPQFWNVLVGEMSLIGPRPERVQYAQRFEETIYRYADRHRVRSGITGWAQVNGLRGATSLSDRVEWDNYYIENWSLWLDLKIALRTIACILYDAVDHVDDRMPARREMPVSPRGEPDPG